MVKIVTSIAIGISALICAPVVVAQASNNDPNGKAFFISSPSCDSYQCHVQHKVGDKMVINWLNPLSGTININFVPNNEQGSKYRIATQLAANHKSTTCQKYGQKSCGAYTWKIPATVKAGDYSVQIHSLTKKTFYAYTDLITITSS